MDISSVRVHPIVFGTRYTLNVYIMTACLMGIRSLMLVWWTWKQGYSIQCSWLKGPPLLLSFTDFFWQICSQIVPRKLQADYN